jgi:hypothetical protein
MPVFAQSVLAAICSLIVTECNVVQTAALLNLCDKFYDFSRNIMKKTFSSQQITTSTQYFCPLDTDCFIHVSGKFFP